MKLGKTGKVLLGLATLWPIIYMALFFIGAISMVSFAGEQGPPRLFPIIFVLHFLTIVWAWGLIVFYIVYVFKSDRVPKEKKALWAAVLFLGNMFAMPVFWYLHIWRAPKDAPQDSAAEE